MIAYIEHRGDGTGSFRSISMLHQFSNSDWKLYHRVKNELNLVIKCPFRNGQLSPFTDLFISEEESVCKSAV